MNLVRLLITISAPNSIGRWRYGLAKVLSTARRTPCFFAIAAAPARSVIFMLGFMGVSTKIILVAGRMAFLMFSNSELSTNVVSTPYRVSSLSRITREGP